MPKNNKLEKEIDELKNRLKREISERQIAEEEIVKSLEQQKRFLLTGSEELKHDVSRVERVKTEILGYTFQSITIVVGLLTLILTLTFFWLNLDKFYSDFFWIFVAIVIFFGSIFVLWFIMWIIRD